KEAVSDRAGVDQDQDGTEKPVVRAETAGDRGAVCVRRRAPVVLEDRPPEGPFVAVDLPGARVRAVTRAGAEKVFVEPGKQLRAGGQGAEDSGHSRGCLLETNPDHVCGPGGSHGEAALRFDREQGPWSG